MTDDQMRQIARATADGGAAAQSQGQGDAAQMSARERWTAQAAEQPAQQQDDGCCTAPKAGG